MTDEAPKKKRKKFLRSSQRSFQWMNNRKWPLTALVEKWVMIPGHPAGGINRDCWGWCDILALDPDGLWIGIQSCAMAARTAHLDKLADPEIARKIGLWLTCPQHRAEVWSWRKLRMEGTKVREKWELHRDALMVKDGKLSYVEHGGLFSAPEPVSAVQDTRPATGLIDELREEMG